jgi:hypothetical protein
MPTNSKLAKEREGANKIAEMLYESLRKLPEEERQARVKAIQKIKISRRSTSKHPATQMSLRGSSPRVTARRKRARP